MEKSKTTGYFAIIDGLCIPDYIITKRASILVALYLLAVYKDICFNREF